MSLAAHSSADCPQWDVSILVVFGESKRRKLSVASHLHYSSLWSNNSGSGKLRDGSIVARKVVGGRGLN